MVANGVGQPARCIGAMSSTPYRRLGELPKRVGQLFDADSQRIIYAKILRDTARERIAGNIEGQRISVLNTGGSQFLGFNSGPSVDMFDGVHWFDFRRLEDVGGIPWASR